MFGRCHTPSVRPSLLMFRIDHPITWISSSLVLYGVPHGSFTLAKRSSSHGLILGKYGGCSRISHCLQRKRSVTAAVWLLALLWRMMGLCTTKCHHFLLNPCDYNLFTKVKGPLRGTRYNTRNEFINAIGRSIRNI